MITQKLLTFSATVGHNPGTHQLD